MLEAGDLQAIRSIVEDVVDKKVNDIIDRRVPVIVDERVNDIIDRRVPVIVDNIVDKRLTESENLILEYVDDTRDVLQNQIAQLKDNMDELNQYYRIHKLENENGTLYLQLINELRKDIEELKQKTA